MPRKTKAQLLRSAGLHHRKMKEHRAARDVDIAGARDAGATLKEICASTELSLRGVQLSLKRTG